MLTVTFCFWIRSLYQVLGDAQHLQRMRRKMHPPPLSNIMPLCILFASLICRRQLNPDLLSSQERTRLSGLVGVLLSCGLTFAPRSAFPGGGNWVEGEGGFGGGRVGKPSYSADGIGAIAPEFVLEPAIDQVSTVGG